MSFHRNAKLGLAGRHALVCAIESGMTLKAAAAAFSVSPATAHRWWHRWREAGEEARASRACLFDRSSRPHRSPRQLAPELAEAICACRLQTGWGPRLVAGATGFCHSTVWKVLKRGRHLAAAEASEGAGQQLRVALPGRSAAHGHERVRALPAPGPPRHLRSALSRAPPPRRRRHRARDRRRPLPTRVRRDPLRSEGRNCRRLPRAGARLLRGARDHREAPDDRQCLGVRAQPPLPRAPHPPRHPTPNDEAVPAVHERQGRALPPDDVPGMGLRPRLPITSRPRRSSATLDRPLQPRQTAQLTRRPASDQPRSQRLWVGHLEALTRGSPARWKT